jgi:hypothetical protein
MYQINQKLKVEQSDTHKRGIIQRIKSLQQNLPPFSNYDTMFFNVFSSNTKTISQSFLLCTYLANHLSDVFSILGPLKTRVFEPLKM